MAEQERLFFFLNNGYTLFCWTKVYFHILNVLLSYYFASALMISKRELIRVHADDLADDFGGFQIAIAEVFEVGHVFIYI